MLWNTFRIDGVRIKTGGVMITNEQLRNKIKRCMVEGILLPQDVNLLALTQMIWNYINKTATTVKVRDFKYAGRTAVLVIEDNQKSPLMIIVLNQQKIEFIMPANLRVSQYNQKALSIAAVLVVKGVERYFTQRSRKTLTPAG